MYRAGEYRDNRYQTISMKEEDNRTLKLTSSAELDSRTGAPRFGFDIIDGVQEIRAHSY